MSAFQKVWNLIKSRPVIRGMIAYGTLWPTGCIIQQTIEGQNFDNYDWKKAIRFGIWGGIFIAPTLYNYMRITTFMWPSITFKTAMIKSMVDQISYTPIATLLFFIGMNLLESKTLYDGVCEAKTKFLPTYQVGLIYWPILQTINYGLIPEKNRIVFVSICSLIWTVFLSYVKFLEKEKFKKINENENSDELIE